MKTQKDMTSEAKQLPGCVYNFNLEIIFYGGWTDKNRNNQSKKRYFERV